MQATPTPKRLSTTFFPDMLLAFLTAEVYNILCRFGAICFRGLEVSLSGELFIEQIMTLMFWRVNSNHSPSERQMRISPETGIGVPAATPGTCKYHFQ